MLSHPAFLLLFSFLSLVFNHDEAEIVFAGDAMMHQGQIDSAYRTGGSYDYSEYFSEIKPYIISADYAVVNLETPISNPPYSGYPCFNSPESYLDALSDAGFNLFLTANNHTLDRRDAGLRNTIAALDRHNLEHIGTYTNSGERAARLPFVKNINGIKVGFVNYTYGTNGFTPGKEVCVDYINRELIRSDVEAARQAGAEFIIACIHWGIEYQLLPHPSQKSLAKYLASIGVDAIIGGHPHVIQPMELTSDGAPKLVVYSLGNFISNMKTCDTRGGAMLRLRLTRGDDGKVAITNAQYRLVYTEPANGKHNFRLTWPDQSKDARAAAFAKSARKVFSTHNIGVDEDKPLLNRIISLVKDSQMQK